MAVDVMRIAEVMKDAPLRELGDAAPAVPGI